MDFPGFAVDLDRTVKKVYCVRIEEGVETSSAP